ncbi:hypothetical protein MA9V1_109 [Chryseobacterium phage MA9V-1]|nr:hypothetical protein MA9V1_109 [Chryseobacterium phage MA9V-1]
MAKQNKHQVVYFETTTGRYGIHAGFLVFNKEQIIKTIQDNSYTGAIRYGIVDGKTYSCLLSQMPIDLFESEFPDHEKLFTTKQITSKFSKAISEKYGEHKLLKAIKTLKPSELKPGYIYQDASGHNDVYLGKATWTESHTKANKVNVEKEGYAFTSLQRMLQGAEGTNAENERMARWANVLKTKRKYVKEVGKFVTKKVLPNYSYFKHEYSYYPRENDKIVNTTTWTLKLHDFTD